MKNLRTVFGRWLALLLLALAVPQSGMLYAMEGIEEGLEEGLGKGLDEAGVKELDDASQELDDLNRQALTDDSPEVKEQIKAAEQKLDALKSKMTPDQLQSFTDHEALTPVKPQEVSFDTSSTSGVDTTTSGSEPSTTTGSEAPGTGPDAGDGTQVKTDGTDTTQGKSFKERMQEKAQALKERALAAKEQLAATTRKVAGVVSRATSAVSDATDRLVGPAKLGDVDIKTSQFADLEDAPDLESAQKLRQTNLDDVTSQMNDKVAAAEKDVGDLKAQLEDDQAALKTAQEKFEGLEKDADGNPIDQEAAQSAREEIQQAQKNIDRTNEELEPAQKDLDDAVAERTAKISEAQSKLDAAEKDFNGLKKVRLRDNFRAAESRVQQAEADLNEASSRLNRATTDAERAEARADYKTASEELEAARADRVQARDAFFKEGRMTGDEYDRAYSEKWSERRWNAAKSAGEKFLEVTWQGGIMGIVMMLPQLAQEAITAAYQKKAQLETLEADQHFGGMLIKIPEFLINTECPESSLYVYATLPGADKDLGANDQATASYLQNNAHYLVEYQQYGNWAQDPITSAQFTWKMVDLNTGYFMQSSGGPVNQQEPCEPLLGLPSSQSQQTAVLGQVQTLASRVSGGAPSEACFTAFQNMSVQTTALAGSSVLQGLFGAPGGATAYPGLFSNAMAGMSAGLPNCSADAQGNLISLFQPANDMPPAATDARAHAWSQQYLIQEFVGMPDLRILGYEANNASPIAGGVVKELNDYMLGNGRYLYQTAATPVVANLRKQWKIAPLAGYNKLAPENIWDYVVCLDADYNIVPLMVPQPGQYGVPTFTLNSLAQYVYSFVTQTAYNLDLTAAASGVTPQQTNFTQELPAPAQLQITAMTQFVTHASQAMPQTAGQYVLNQVYPAPGQTGSSNVFVYQVAGFLSKEGTAYNGGDDYFVALDSSNNILELGASAAPKYFVSLVTSRFYTSEFLPFGLDQTQPSQKWKWVQGYPTGVTIPLYSAYMSAETNPYNYGWPLVTGPNAPRYKAATSAQFVAVPDMFCYTGLALVQGQGSASASAVQAVVQAAAPQLDATIVASYKAWKPAFIALNTKGQPEKIGPFQFTTSLWNNIYITPEPTAFGLGLYIYTSASFPGDYFVVSSTNIPANFSSSNVGNEFIGQSQPYLVSLTSGAIYQGDPSLVAMGQTAQTWSAKVEAAVGTKIAQAQDLSSNGKLMRAIGFKKLPVAMQQKIQAAQGYANASLSAQEYPNYFGQFTLKIGADYLRQGQYIYAKITSDIANPHALDLSTAEGLAKVSDFFVMVDNAGNYATPLTGQTVKAISMVSGQIFTRQGYAGAYSDGFQYLELLTKAVQEHSSAPVPGILITRLHQLTSKATAEQEAIAGEITQMKAAYALQYPLLAGAGSVGQAGNFVDNILNATSVSSGANGTLVKFQNKYYVISPDQTTILDFAARSTDPHTKQTSYIGIVYNALNQAGNVDSNSGTPLHAMRAYLLDVTRGQYGIIVDGQGNETLGQQGMLLSLPVKDAKGANAMILQKIAPVKVGSNTCTFYYNTVLQAYYAKIASPSNSSFYLGMIDGQTYNLNGAPRLADKAVVVMSGTAGSMLISADPYGYLSFQYQKKNDTVSMYVYSGQQVAQDDTTKNYMIVYTMMNNDTGDTVYAVPTGLTGSQSLLQSIVAAQTAQSGSSGSSTSNLASLQKQANGLWQQATGYELYDSNDNLIGKFAPPAIPRTVSSALYLGIGSDLNKVSAAAAAQQASASSSSGASTSASSASTAPVVSTLPIYLELDSNQNLKGVVFNGAFYRASSPIDLTNTGSSTLTSQAAKTQLTITCYDTAAQSNFPNVQPGPRALGITVGGGQQFYTYAFSQLSLAQIASFQSTIWNLVPVTTFAGSTILEPVVATPQMPVQQTPAGTAPADAQEIQQNLQNVYQDPTSGIFMYQFNSGYTLPFQTSAMLNWYVDLASGALMQPQTQGQNSMLVPTGAAFATPQMWELFQYLGVWVVNGKLSYFTGAPATTGAVSAASTASAGAQAS